MPIDFPDSPTIGDTHTVNGRTWEWDGSVWLVVEEVPLFSYVGDTPPENPQTGSGWFDTTTARFLVYYDGYWIESGTSSAFPEVSTPLSYDAQTNSVSIDLSGKSDVGHTHNINEVGQGVSTKTVNYTLQAADANTTIQFTQAGDVNLTIPNVLSIGDYVNVVQYGTGAVTLVASGITLNAFDGALTTAGQYSVASILCVGSGLYVAGGRLA